MGAAASSSTQKSPNENTITDSVRDDEVSNLL
jgi:hypothetical protein